MAWKISLYERLNQHFKLSLANFTYKKREENWSQVLRLLSIHVRSEKITLEEAESLKLKAKGYYDKRVWRLEKNFRWRKKLSLTKQADERMATTASADEPSDEYKMDGSSRE